MNHNKLKKFEDDIVCTKESRKYYINKFMNFWDFAEKKEAFASNSNHYLTKCITKNIEKFKDKNATLYLKPILNSEYYKYNNHVKRNIDLFIKTLNNKPSMDLYSMHDGSDGYYYIDTNNIIRCIAYSSPKKRYKYIPKNIVYSSGSRWVKSEFIMTPHSDGSLIEEKNGSYYFRFKEIIDAWSTFSEKDIQVLSKIPASVKTRFTIVYRKGKQLNKKELKKYGYIV